MNRVSVVLLGVLPATILACVGDNPVGPTDASTSDGATYDATAPGDAATDASDAGSDAADGAAAPPSSCLPGGNGMTNCGSGAESCCTSLPVAGGSFDRTYTNDGGGPASKADPATVADFRLDKYEVTVGRFRQFVAEWKAGSGWVPPAGSGKHTHLNGGLGLANAATPGTYETGWVTADNGNIAPTNPNLACNPASTWTPSPGSQENLPINCVNWYEAVAFCIWDGGFLPSEAEWEYAAAGGSQDRQYPWGNAAPGTTNQYAIYGCYYPSGSGSCNNTNANIAPVGTPTAGAGVWGQLDLGGNVWEWNLDWLASYANPCTNCANVTAATNRVMRGGAFINTTNTLHAPYRNSATSPTDRSELIGIRCARSP